VIGNLARGRRVEQEFAASWPWAGPDARLSPTAQRPIVGIARTAGVFGMPDYYVYFLNDNGRVYARQDIKKDGDVQAIEAATELLMIYQMRHPAAEVWQGSRMVRKLTRASMMME
jgi:hypothetical protein